MAPARLTSRSLDLKSRMPWILEVFCGENTAEVRANDAQELRIDRRLRRLWAASTRRVWRQHLCS